MRSLTATPFLLTAVALRVAMNFWPTLFMCLVFWVSVVAAMILSRNYWIVPGLVCNAAVMLANGGVMPVYGQDGPFSGFHVQGTPDSSLQFLGDVLPGGFSVGDVLILLGGVAIVCSRLNLFGLTVEN